MLASNPFKELTWPGPGRIAVSRARFTGGWQHVGAIGFAMP